MATGSVKPLGRFIPVTPPSARANAIRLVSSGGKWRRAGIFYRVIFDRVNYFLRVWAKGRPSETRVRKAGYVMVWRLIDRRSCPILKQL